MSVEFLLGYESFFIEFQKDETMLVGFFLSSVVPLEVEQRMFSKSHFFTYDMYGMNDR